MRSRPMVEPVDAADPIARIEPAPLPRVYVLDSEAALGDALAAPLGTYGYAVRMFADRASLMAAAAAEPPAVIIADALPADAGHIGAEIVRALALPATT